MAPSKTAHLNHDFAVAGMKIFRKPPGGPISRIETQRQSIFKAVHAHVRKDEE